jgi:hypothetical protein
MKKGGRGLPFLPPAAARPQRAGSARPAMAALAAMLADAALQARRLVVEGLLLLRRQHGVEAVDGAQALFHRGGAPFLAFDVLRQALRRAQVGRRRRTIGLRAFATRRRFHGSDEGVPGVFLDRRDLQLVVQPGHAPGGEFGALFLADGVAVAALGRRRLSRIRGGGLGMRAEGGGAHRQGGQCAQEVLAKGSHISCPC